MIKKITVLMIIGAYFSLSSCINQSVLFVYKSNYDISEFVSEYEIQCGDSTYFAAPPIVPIINFFDNRCEGLDSNEFEILSVKNEFKGDVDIYSFRSNKLRKTTIKTEFKKSRRYFMADTLEMDENIRNSFKTLIAEWKNPLTEEACYCVNDFSNISHDNERLMIIKSSNKTSYFLYNISGIKSRKTTDLSRRFVELLLLP